MAPETGPGAPAGAAADEPGTPAGGPVLVVFAHLASHRSRVNAAMLGAIAGLDGVVVRDLPELYPDFYIDREAEQALLRAADLLVFQCPVYWYGVPALLKHWQDVVLTRGFAFGAGGDALRGKGFALALSTGAPREAFSAQGAHGHPLEDFLLPFVQTARLCGMRWLAPLVFYGGPGVGDAAVEAHAAGYRALLARHARGGHGPGGEG